MQQWDQLFRRKQLCYFICTAAFPLARIAGQRPGPSPGCSSRGGGKNPKGEPHFKNTVLDVCSNRWAKREMGGAGTTDSPAGGGPRRIQNVSRSTATLICWLHTKTEASEVGDVIMPPRRALGRFPVGVARHSGHMAELSQLKSFDWAKLLDIHGFKNFILRTLSRSVAP